MKSNSVSSQLAGKLVALLRGGAWIEMHQRIWRGWLATVALLRGGAWIEIRR